MLFCQGIPPPGAHGTGCIVLYFPLVFLADPTKEGESRGAEGESTAQVAALIAQGVLRPLYDTSYCPTCTLSMQHEAAYKCKKCDGIFHVRCMGHYAAVGGRQISYGIHCFLCSMALSSSTNPPTPILPSDVHVDCVVDMALPSRKGTAKRRDRGQPDVIDVMGVCD